MSIRRLLASHTNPTTSKAPPKVVRSGPVDVCERNAFHGAFWKARRFELDDESLTSKHTRTPSPSLPPSTARRSIRVAAPDAIDNERRLHLSLAADSELHDWQDDIYSRASQLSGASSPPFRFVHKVHVSADAAGNFGDASILPIYAEIVGGGSQPAAAASALPRSRHFDCAGPAGVISLNVSKTPSPPGSALSALGAQGRYLVAQSGVFSRWLAKMRWVSLNGQVLVIHRGADKTSPPSKTIPLPTLTRIAPDPKRTTTLLLELTPKATTASHPQQAEVLYLSFSKDADLCAWRDALSAPPPPGAASKSEEKRARRGSLRKSGPLPVGAHRGCRAAWTLSVVLFDMTLCCHAAYMPLSMSYLKIEC
ncbi:hypothetical protein BJ912DRAFT_925724 [Pholiota molesta]|nr:hypothetical protein BJ912DRAFT_925724 [Pholiota molesta]